jgi:polyamine oxidase
MSIEGFLPSSNIILVTLVENQSYRIERQSDDDTKAEVMAVLAKMFQDITVPDPIAFFFTHAGPKNHGPSDPIPTGLWVQH